MVHRSGGVHTHTNTMPPIHLHLTSLHTPSGLVNAIQVCFINWHSGFVSYFLHNSLHVFFMNTGNYFSILYFHGVPLMKLLLLRVLYIDDELFFHLLFGFSFFFQFVLLPRMIFFRVNTIPQFLIIISYTFGLLSYYRTLLVSHHIVHPWPPLIILS